MNDFYKLVYYDFFIERELLPFLITLITFGIIFIFTCIFVIIEVRKIRSKGVK